MLAGFPIRIALIEELSLQSTTLAWLLIIGIAGVWAGGIYSLYNFILKPDTPTEIRPINKIVPLLLVVGVAALIFLGLFPHLIYPMMADLLSAYPRLLGLP